MELNSELDRKRKEVKELKGNFEKRKSNAIVKVDEFFKDTVNTITRQKNA